MTNARVHPESGTNNKGTEEKRHAGPTRDRGCTDVIFLLLFIGFVGGMVVVASLASKIGKPERLVSGVDSYGNLCGATNSDVAEGASWRDMSSKPYLVFANPLVPRTLQVCVERCPTEFSDETLVTADTVICRQGQTLSSNPAAALLETFGRGCLDQATCKCFVTYPSVDVIRRCIPSANTNITATAIVAASESEVAKEILTDVYAARFVVLACAGITLVLGFVWLIMLRMCGGFIVWTTLVLVLLALGAVAFLGLYFGQTTRTQYQKDKALGNALDRTRNQYIVLFIVGGLFAAIFLIVFFSLVFMRTRINLAVEVIKEAAQTLGAVPSMLLLPLIVFVLLAGFIAAWIVVALYLGTAGKPRFSTTPPENFPTEPHRLLEFVSDGALRRLQAYHVFGGLWVVQFLLAFNQLAIAGAAATDFFAGETPGVRFPLVTSVWYTIRYHLGTLAFGSLTIAIIQFIRLMLVFLERNLKGAKNNELCKFVLRCLGYLFACVERFLKFISRNSYIMTSINGHNFCRAAKDAYTLLVSNALRLLAVQWVSAFIIVLGKLVVICVTGVVAFFWLRAMDLKFWAIPLILILVIAFAIAALFMSVFEMTIDTIFLCVCEDLAHFEGAHLEGGLRDFVDKNKDTSSSD